MADQKPIPISVPDLTERERAYLLEAFDSSWISSRGSFVTEFEAQFAEFAGAMHAISCTNGTCALHLALAACGIGPGDEVVVPALTYISTANAVRYLGAEPVFADCDPRTWNVDPQSVRRMLGPKTRAIVAVHLLGVPADLDALRRIADDAPCFLVEDAAETPGACWSGRRVGSVGDVATFSFYGNKIITTGEGGMVCTGDDHLAARIRKLRGQAADPRRHYWFDEVGYNYRMTNLACAIGLAQLSRFEELAAKRAAVRSWYEATLADRSSLLQLQHRPPQAAPAWWIVGIVLAEDLVVDRDAVRAGLEDEGIETRPFFTALNALPVYRACRSDGGCPVARRLGERGIMLPTHGNLHRDDVQRVARALLAAVQEPVSSP